MTTLKGLLARTAATLPLFFFGITNALAQTNPGGSTGGDNPDFTLEPLGNVADEILFFIDDTIVPVIFAIAFIVFIWGVYTYFIQGGANEEKRSEGKQLVLWGIIGFFVMFSLWGLVNILIGTLGPESATTPCIPQFSGDCAR